MKNIFNGFKIGIVVLILYGFSNACIKVEPKYKYPSLDCYWAEDVATDSAFIGVVRIDSIVQMHSDEDSDYQHFTYKVHYSNTKTIFNMIESSGVFVYQSLSICGTRADIELKVGNEYLVSISRVKKIPYSEMYVGTAKVFFDSNMTYMIINRFASKDQSDKIKETILRSQEKCKKIENENYQNSVTPLEELE